MESKKEIALRLLEPYIKDKSTCGIEDGCCKYETSDGRHCIAGSVMKPIICGEHLKDIRGSIGMIITKYSQAEIFRTEYVDVFTLNEWNFLQNIHDTIGISRFIIECITDIDVAEKINRDIRSIEEEW